jgi:hypothetical protein
VAINLVVILLMAIGCFFIGGYSMNAYWCFSIGGYSMSAYWLFFYWWLFY